MSKQELTPLSQTFSLIDHLLTNLPTKPSQDCQIVNESAVANIPM